MPSYSYKCDKCGEIVQEMRKFADRDRHVQCKCGEGTSHFIPFVPGDASGALIFKGSWFKTTGTY